VRKDRSHSVEARATAKARTGVEGRSEAGKSSHEHSR
jgi:hypothetical protein